MISLTRLRDALKLEPGDDDRLRGIRAAVIAQFERLAGGLFERRVDHVQILRPPHDRCEFLHVELGPLESISKVEERYRGEPWVEIAAGTAFELIEERRLERMTGYWLPQVRVTCTGGYVATPGAGQFGTPEDLAATLVTQALFRHERLGAGKVAVTSQGFEGGSTSFERADYHPDFLAAAARYRRFA